MHCCDYRLIITMLLKILSLLPPERLQTVISILKEAPFVNGTLSAGSAAKRVKNNEEVAMNAGQMSQLNNIVMASLVANPQYKSAALPHRIAAPFYARYTEGMEYGDHVDDPVMGAADRYRSDISITVFLSGPEDYDGGELVIKTSFGEQLVKLNAGDAVLYPSSSLHHVNPVTRGERLVAVTWVQSMVRSAEQRELLYQLNTARENLLQAKPEAEASKTVDICYANLVRMWSEL